jgi:hypothetical protein
MLAVFVFKPREAAGLLLGTKEAALSLFLEDANAWAKFCQGRFSGEIAPSEPHNVRQIVAPSHRGRRVQRRQLQGVRSSQRRNTASWISKGHDAPCF